MAWCVFGDGLDIGKSTFSIACLLAAYVPGYRVEVETRAAKVVKSTIHPTAMD